MTGSSSRGFLVGAILLFAVSANAEMIAGVRVPSSVSIGKDQLALNGAALQERFVFDVTVVSFYTGKPVRSTDEAVRANAKKHLQFHLLRNLSRAQLHDVIRQGLGMGLGNRVEPLKPHVDRFLAKLPSVKRGDVMSITFVPGEGTTLRINGKPRITIEDEAFAEAIFGVWLGPRPIDRYVQRNLLTPSGR